MGFHVGKYTMTMDGMGFITKACFLCHQGMFLGGEQGI